MLTVKEMKEVWQSAHAAVVESGFTLEELKEVYLNAFASIVKSDYGTREYEIAEAEMTAVEIELGAMGYSSSEVNTMLIGLWSQVC